VIASLHDKSDVVFRDLRKDKIACPKFVDILVVAIGSQKNY
jgi:hypothetical protein